MLSRGSARACSIFMAEGDGVVLAGNNEDYYLDVKPKIWVHKGKKGEYARISFGFNQDNKTDEFAQGGMNSKGLFFDAAVTPRGPEQTGKKKRKPPENMGDAMLAHCATVEEAIRWLAKYNLYLLKGSHFLLADATGAAAVVELVEGEMKVIPKEGRHQAVTNYSLTKPEMGNFPCPRFEKLSTGLASGTPVTVEGFRDLLQSVSVPKSFMKNDKRYGGTLYSNVYDLTHKIIYVYPRTRFEHVLAIDFEEYIATGDKTYELDELTD